MSEREKKIAEIREALRRVEFGTYRITAFADLEYWLRFLLSELDRIQQEYAEERAAHNAHVTELCQLEEKNRKLREERDEARSKAEEAWKEIDSLEDQLLSAQQDRDKLIEGLRWYADKTNYVQEVHHLRRGTLIGPAEAIYYDEGQRARDILREVGVTVE